MDMGTGSCSAHPARYNHHRPDPIRPGAEGRLLAGTRQGSKTPAAIGEGWHHALYSGLQKTLEILTGPQEGPNAGPLGRQE